LINFVSLALPQVSGVSLFFLIAVLSKLFKNIFYCLQFFENLGDTGILMNEMLAEGWFKSPI